MSFYNTDVRPPHDPATCTRTPCGRCRPAGVAKPPRQVDHDVAAPPQAPDRPVAAMGLPSHPDPQTIAGVLEDAAKAIRKSGLRAIDMASVLAAKGYSSATLGDGGSRGTDTTSSTERHAARAHRWEAADHGYAEALRTVWQASLQAVSSTHELLRHADDIDATPAGTGECRACARFVRPTKERPSFRLRSGLCPSCFGAWCSYKAKGPMLWAEWVAKRREGFTERDALGRVVRIHTPEPEADGQGA